jgi:hypothetical protein
MQVMVLLTQVSSVQALLANAPPPLAPCKCCSPPALQVASGPPPPRTRLHTHPTCPCTCVTHLSLLLSLPVCECLCNLDCRAEGSLPLRHGHQRFGWTRPDPGGPRAEATDTAAQHKSPLESCCPPPPPLPPSARAHTSGSGLARPTWQGLPPQRHVDHMCEWTRAEYRAWTPAVAPQHSTATYTPVVLAAPCPPPP